jgi:hypothetical protein
VQRAGVRKLILINSHGGNVPMVDIVTRELRVRHDMLVVGTAWSRFGHPDGISAPEEAFYGIHGGESKRRPRASAPRPRGMGPPRFPFGAARFHGGVQAPAPRAGSARLEGAGPTWRRRRRPRRDAGRPACRASGAFVEPCADVLRSIRRVVENDRFRHPQSAEIRTAAFDLLLARRAPGRHDFRPVQPETERAGGNTVASIPAPAADVFELIDDHTRHPLT